MDKQLFSSMTHLKGTEKFIAKHSPNNELWYVSDYVDSYVVEQFCRQADIDNHSLAIFVHDFTYKSSQLVSQDESVAVLDRSGKARMQKRINDLIHMGFLGVADNWYVRLPNTINLEKLEPNQNCTEKKQMTTLSKYIDVYENKEDFIEKYSPNHELYFVTKDVRSEDLEQICLQADADNHALIATCFANDFSAIWQDECGNVRKEIKEKMKQRSVILHKLGFVNVRDRYVRLPKSVKPTGPKVFALPITNLIPSITQLDKLRGQTVEVNVDELLTVLHNTVDNALTVSVFVNETNWVQELRNSGRHNNLPGFPSLELSKARALSLWVKNLLAQLGHNIEI